MSCLTWANSKSTKHPQVGIIYWFPTPYFHRCLKVQSRWWTSIYQIHCSISNFTPETLGRLASKSMHLTHSKMNLFILSAKPFCWGVLAIGLCLLISYFLQNSLNCYETNSSPLCVLKTFSLVPYLFSTSVCHSLNLWNVSN